MKKLIPLIALAAGLVLAGCNQNGNNNGSTGSTETSAAMTNSSPAGTNAAPAQ